MERLRDRPWHAARAALALAGHFQRKYSHGIVVLAEPGTRPTTVHLPGEFHTLDGAPKREVVISGREGMS